MLICLLHFQLLLFDTTEEGESDSFFHIHDYCEKWDKTNTSPMRSTLNNFLEDYWTDGCKARPDITGVCDDIETGLAGCYLFEANDKSEDDDLMKNFKANKELAISTIEYIFATKHYHNPVTGELDSLEPEDIEYFNDLYKLFTEMNYE